MKLGVVAYLPPDFGFTDAFLENLRQWKTTNPLYLYSDDPEKFGCDIAISNPGQAVSYRNVPLAINNYVFIKGVEIAVANGLDYYIYLENDCRVRTPHWDERLFNEFLEYDDAVMGGTPSIWNAGISGAPAAIKAIEFSQRVVRKTGRPPLLWQSVAGRGSAGLWLYPNGAGAIFHTATVAAIYAGAKHDIGTYCATLSAWDVHAGKAMWNAFNLECFDRFATLKSEYSGYHDTHYSLSDRQRMLTSGEVVLVHQIKCPWIPEKS